MNKQCLYCYLPLAENITADFHERCSLAFFGTREAPGLLYTFDQMEELARNVVERSIAIPGVQPKISLNHIKEAMTRTHSRLTVVGALGGNYIFKPPNRNYPELPENENLTMRIAESFEIRTVPSSLIRLQSGELSYITKRIDRTDNGGKIHMLDMFQITEAIDKYKSSLEKIGKALSQHSFNTQLDQLYFFEVCLFSFLTGNNDMHLKNFSMIAGADGWSLSPVYDLLNTTIVNPEDSEEMALTIDGKKSKIKREHFMKLGKNLRLSERQLSSVFKRFSRQLPTANDWIAKSFLSENMKLKYSNLISERYERMEL